MSYLALYRKYRPTTFDEVFGQKYIVDIIKNAVINNKVSHAYLFSGPRGTGKTTIAKLLARIVNCSNINPDTVEPCDSCNSCSLIVNKSNNPDIVEIDAASNNGVDEIRTIRDNVSLMPSVSKYKVYIIDEVHMLSSSAFNALLKTLEEPPAHVIFVLATTELYKVPETIVSRCQCYEFERLNNIDIVACLKRIVLSEKLNVDDEVLELVADYSNGGMRDSISLLDKLCSCSDFVDKKLFYEIVGLVDESQLKNLIDKMMSGSYKDSLSVVSDMEKNGKNIVFLISQIIKYLRNQIVSENGVYSDQSLMFMIDGFNDMQYGLRFSNNLSLSFETGILKIVNKLKSSQSEKIISREIIDDDVVSKKDVIASEPSNIKAKEEKSEQNVELLKKPDFSRVINNAFALADKNLKNELMSKWNGFYDFVHNKEFSGVVSYLLDGTLQVVGKKDVIVSVSYDSVLDSASSNISKIELLFNLVMGNAYNIAFVLDSEWDVLKEKYISDIKSGKKYEYIESNDEKNVIIENENVASSVSPVGYDSDAEKSAVGLFGSDIVEIK